MQYIIVLLLTIIIEAIVYLIYKRDKNLLLSSVFLNIITNPTLNFLVYLFAQYRTPLQNLEVILGLELLVVIVEYALLRYVGYKGIKIMTLVFIANLISFLSGVLVFGLDIK